MPELPEVETTCNGIRPYLENNQICSVDVHNSRLRWPVSEEIESLKQVKVISVTRRAKYIFIKTSLGHIICHLGMSGSLRISNSDEALKKHDHVIFHLTNLVQIRYNDPRRFGCILWCKDSPSEHKLISHLGPEPLSKEFSLVYFIKICKTSKSPIKQFIMNNKVVVGVGNIYACESLFLSNISPLAPANSLSKKKLEILLKNIQTTLTNAIKQGGTTLRDFVNHDGKPGYFQQELLVYNREGKKCHECDADILRITQAQRSTFYCRKCQK